MSIFHLAQNEFIKITRKKGTLLSLFFLFLIVLLAGLIMNHELDASSDNNWKERLLAEKNRKKLINPLKRQAFIILLMLRIKTIIWSITSTLMNGTAGGFSARLLQTGLRFSSA